MGDEEVSGPTYFSITAPMLILYTYDPAQSERQIFDKFKQNQLSNPFGKKYEKTEIRWLSQI